MLDAMRFWFDRGVDGFRIDILWHMIKGAQFRDNPPNPDWQPGMADMHKVLQLHSTDQPEVFEIAAVMRALADSYGDKLLVGEIYLPVERLMAYYGKAGEGVHLPFNFQLIDAPWDAAELHRMVHDYEAALPEGGWPNWVLGNHDRPRIASRVGEAQARIAAMLLLTMRGTPTIYYGDELGLTDVAIPPSQVQDPRELREPGLGFGRDPVRTPMPWDDTAQAGFTTGEPWLPLNPDWRTRNAAVEAGDAGSMLSLYRDLLRLRRTQPPLSLGDVRLLAAHEAVLAYERTKGDARIVVALNLSDREQPFDLPEGRVLLTSGGDYAPGRLAPNQGLVLEVAA
jgi:alpha-glucosidase